MKIEETLDGNLHVQNPLSKGLVIFPENDEELELINYLLKKEPLKQFKEDFKIKVKQKLWM